MDDTSPRLVGTVRLIGTGSILPITHVANRNRYMIGYYLKVDQEKYPYCFPFVNESWEWFEIADTATEWERQEIQLFRLIGAAEWERLHAEEMFKRTVAIAG